MIKPAWLLFFLITFFSSTSAAATRVDVLLVFSDDVALSNTEKTVVAARYQAALSDVYDDQLNGVRTIEVMPLILPEMSYRSTAYSG